MRRIDPDAHVTRAQASQLTGVTADAIGKWHARGWLAPDGTRQRLGTKRLANGNLLYRVGDILRAESDTEANSNCRRGVVRRRNWPLLDVNTSGMAHAS